MEVGRRRRRTASPDSYHHPGYWSARLIGSFYDSDANANWKNPARVADYALCRQLPEVAPLSLEKDHDCAICLQRLASSSSPEENQKEETIRAMPCSHVFHERCIFQWIRLNPDCPLCRRTLPTPQEQGYDDDDDDQLQLTIPVRREMLEIEVL